MSRALLFLSVLVFLAPLPYSHAQYGDTESPEAEPRPEEGVQDSEESGPVVIEQQPYEYYYWPEKDLDNFGLSTLGQGQGGSTLGRNLQRKSNIEVNTPKEPPQNAGDTDTESGDGDEDTDLYPPEETGDDSGSVDEVPQAGPKESEFYEWVDEKGNVHITNNIGDVPLEYQKEIYEQNQAPPSE